MYQAKSGVKNFSLYWGGGGSLDKKFFCQSEHVSSQIWCQKFFPLLGGGGLDKKIFPSLNMYQAKSPPDLGPLRPGPGTPPTWTWDLPPPGPGTPLLPGPGPGTPPRCELTNKLKTVPSRRTTYVGGKKNRE